jgi:hypothetical protein
MTRDHLPEAGDEFDVFVIRGRRGGKLTGYLCKATAIWNGSTALLPYSLSPDLGGFTVKTTALTYGGVKFDGRFVHSYERKRTP